MLKGVNHQIIEITQPDNPYFERALLFVKTDYADYNAGMLHREGERFVKGADGYSDLRSKRAKRWFSYTLWLLLGAFCGMYMGILLS